MKAYGTGDHETICKAMGPFGQANVDVYQSKAKAQVEMLALLNPEQKAKWQEYLVIRNAKGSFYGTKFDDKQLDKIIEVYEKIAKDTTLDPQQLRARLVVKVESDILTPEQRLAPPRPAIN